MWVILNMVRWLKVVMSMMRNAKLALMTFLTVPLATACVVVSESDDRPRNPRLERGDVTIELLFEGRLCDVAGVDVIDVDVQGRTEGDRYSDSLDCQTFRDGLVIEDLIVDRYDVTLQGRNTAGDLLYSTDNPSMIVVNPGVTRVSVDAAGLGGDLTVYWTFEGQGSCGPVNELRVTLRDPSGFIYDDALYPCDFGGVTYEFVTDGLWNMDVDGLDASGRLMYQTFDRGLVVIRNANNEYTLDLDAVR